MTSTESLQQTPAENSTGSNHFGQNLRALRKKARFTQEELAHRVGVSIMSIRRWEWGDTLPRAEEIKRLAAVFNVREQVLLSDKPADRWVLTVHISQDDVQEEVIDLSKEMPTVSAVLSNHSGGYIRLGGNYELWADNDNFKQLIADLKKARDMVIQNGRAFGIIKDDKPDKKK